MATEVKKLQFSEGTDVGAPTDLGIATSTTTISAYADDAAFVSANGAASNGDVYLNSTTKKFRMYIGSAWRNVVPESDPTDATKLFLVDVSGNSTGVSVTLDFNATSNRTVTFTDESQTVANIAGTQTFTNKTIDGGKFTNGFDVPSAGNATIGASVGANNLTLGGATTNVVIPGNLNVQGSSTILNTATLDVEDTNITVNDGGNDATAEGAGLTVERTTTNGSLIYENALASKWKAGAAGSEVELANVSSNQTLTNKRVNLSTTAAANDTTSPRLVLPANTYANLSAISGANHLAEGAIYWASDVNKAYLWDGSALTEVGSGSGSGGINYITNSDFETDTTGWGTYKDTAGLLPVDGTLGTALYTTISRNTTTPLRGTADLKIAKSANNAQGEGASFTFTIDSADSVSPKVQQISFDYRVTSAFDYGTFSAPATDPSDVVVYIYDVTNARLIQPTPFTLDGSGRFNGTFQNNAGSTSYRLIFHIAGTNASAWDFFADNISVGPQIKQHGFSGNDPKLVTVTGSWSTNTTYTAYETKTGKFADYDITISLSGAPDATPLTINLPTGRSIDTTAWSAGTASTNYMISGSSVQIFESTGPQSYVGSVAYESSTSVRIKYNTVISSVVIDPNSNVASGAPNTMSSGDKLYIKFRVPISGWSSNTLVSSDADTRVVAARLDRLTSNQSIPNNSITVIQFNSTTYDTSAAWDGTNYRWFCKVAGYYKASTNIGFVANGTGSRQVSIRKNGTDISREVELGNASISPIINVTAETQMNVGDYLDVIVYQNSGVSLNVEANQPTFFTVSKISGPATIAASEVVSCIITGNPANVTAGNPVIYPTRLSDSHNAYNVSTGEFKVPIAGDYVVIESQGATFSANAVVSAYVNGSQQFPIMDVVQSSIGISAGTTKVKCNVGDIITVRNSQNSSSYSGSNGLAIHRIGGVM